MMYQQTHESHVGSTVPMVPSCYDCSQMRAAIVSDALFTYGGAERVLEQILQLFPAADLFALVNFLPPDANGFLAGRGVRTTFIQNLPFARRHFRLFLHLWGNAIEQLDLQRYDLVICSHHGVAHGVLTSPEQVHVSYTHSPMRYVWDLQTQYLDSNRMMLGPAGWWARRVLREMRAWDSLAGSRVDRYAANSGFVARRIGKYYRRSATVIYPPVAVEDFALSNHKQDYYLSAGRLAPYKRTELIVKAFARMPDRTLIVAGAGPQLAELRRTATSNVRLLGRVDDKLMKALMQNARAFIFAGIEDFGIAPLEAQACGTPVIAYNQGGLSETIRGTDSKHPTGLFFMDQSVDAIIEAVQQFEAIDAHLSPEDCRANALRFVPSEFRHRFMDFITTAVREKQQSRFACYPCELESAG
jgi:glycosyltransferase involved in cell wall biosynthesis